MSCRTYSERMIRSALRSIPDGTYQTEDYNDQVFESGNPAAFRVTLTIEGDHATFDLSDSDETVPGSINTTIVSTTSSLFNSLGAILPPMPMNAGVMRAIEIKNAGGGRSATRCRRPRCRCRRRAWRSWWAAACRS